jgi:hypothetical protein
VCAPAVSSAVHRCVLTPQAATVHERGANPSPRKRDKYLAPVQSPRRAADPVTPSAKPRTESIDLVERVNMRLALLSTRFSDFSITSPLSDGANLKSASMLDVVSVQDTISHPNTAVSEDFHSYTERPQSRNTSSPPQVLVLGTPLPSRVDAELAAQAQSIVFSFEPPPGNHQSDRRDSMPSMPVVPFAESAVEPPTEPVQGNAGARPGAAGTSPAVDAEVRSMNMQTFASSTRGKVSSAILTAAGARQLPGGVQSRAQLSPGGRKATG